MANNLPKWNDERVATLTDMAGTMDGEVSASIIEQAAEALGTSARSVAAKLRNIGYTVESMAQIRVSPFSDEEKAELAEFLANNEGAFTYAEIAATLFEGQYTSKQIQGKILSMELTGLVKATPKVETPKVYNDAEEATFIKMAEAGSFLEEIADALGKPLNSVRGKALSLNSKLGLAIPKQRDRKPDKVDPFEALSNIQEMTVEEIASRLDKSVRGVKTMLTHRGITAVDYDGAKRAAKLADKKAATS